MRGRPGRGRGRGRRPQSVATNSGDDTVPAPGGQHSPAPMDTTPPADTIPPAEAAVPSVDMAASDSASSSGSGLVSRRDRGHRRQRQQGQQRQQHQQRQQRQQQQQQQQGRAGQQAAERAHRAAARAASRPGLPGGWAHPALYRYVLEHCQLEYGWQEDLAADIKRTVDSFANRAHAQLLSWVAELEPAVHSADNLPAELRAALRGHFAVCLPQATASTYGPGDEAGGPQPST